MKNLCHREYNLDADKEVKTELEIADIPVLQLPNYMNTEVKTQHIGLLKDFMFYRAWIYWVCKGFVPIDKAIKLYDDTKDSDLGIRTEGYAGNIDPRKFHRGIKNGKEGVVTYHIDTQLGLCYFVKFIKSEL